MKTSFTKSWVRESAGVVVALILASVPAEAGAPDDPGKAPRTTQPSPARVRRGATRSAEANRAASARALFTDSRIPQRVAADGYHPQTGSPVTLITSDQIQRMGAVNVGQALRRASAGAN